MGSVIVCVILCVIISFSIKSICKKHLNAKKSGECCCCCSGGCSCCSSNSDSSATSAGSACYEYSDKSV